MDAKLKRTAPADFELVLSQGIHPFYLGMEADEVLEAAAGWKIAFSERDFGGIEVHFEKGGRIIEVNLINTVHLYPGHYGDYRAYYIYTEAAAFSDGTRLSRMKKENVLARFTGEHALKLDDSLNDGDGIYYSSYKNEETSLSFYEHLKPTIAISRMPKFPWDERD